MIQIVSRSLRETNRAAMMAAVLLPSLLLLTGCGSTPPPPASDAKTGIVTIEFQGGEQLETVRIENVADGTTLESLMRDVSEVKVSLTGSGSTAFVDSIGEQSTGASEGWTFKIDGEFSNDGIGTTVLHPPTTVTWSYGTWDD